MKDFKRAMKERDQRLQNRKDLIEVIVFIGLCGFVFWLLPKLLNGEIL